MLHRKPITEIISIAREEGFNWILQPRRWEINLKHISLTKYNRGRNVAKYRRAKQEKLVNRRQVVD